MKPTRLKDIISERRSMTAEEFMRSEFSVSGYGKPILPGSFLRCVYDSKEGRAFLSTVIRKAYDTLSLREFLRLKEIWISYGGEWVWQ